MLAQPAFGQTKVPPGPGTLPVGDRQFRERFQELLQNGQRRDFEDGWRLCQELGRPAVPMLWDLYDKQGGAVRLRLVLMVAAVLAGGTAEDERLLQALESTGVEERVLGALLIALGPRRPATAANPFARLTGRRKDVVLQVAAYLAASRFPSAALDPRLPAPTEIDPGLIAAAALAGVPGNREPWFPTTVPPPPPKHAELVRRGTLLGRVYDPGVDQALLQRAETLFKSDTEPHESRLAAGILLGRAGRLPEPAGANKIPRPPWNLLEGLLTLPAGARALHEWLGPVPTGLDVDPRRLLSAYVFSRSVAEVLAEQERWSASPLARRPVTLTLALRLLSEPAATPNLGKGLTDLPEWYWVAWAAGQRPARPAAGEDPLLEAAVDLAVDGRLPRATARVLLEETLWRSEAHPALPLWQCHRALVRDLLLTGTLPGTRYAGSVPQHVRYLAKGLEWEDPVFQVAVAYFEFTNQPRSPLPPECRLP